MKSFPGLALATEDLALAVPVDPHWKAEALRACLGGANDFEAAFAPADDAALGG